VSQLATALQLLALLLVLGGAALVLTSPRDAATLGDSPRGRHGTALFVAGLALAGVARWGIPD